jgi:2-isopropylmalate synthase
MSVDAGTEAEALQDIKEAEARGLSYESAEASVALLLRRKKANYTPLFEILDYQIQVGKRGASDTFAEAVVKIRVGDELLHTAASGNGPVGALDAALRKALLPVYPSVNSIHLADYKVRILDSASGTGAITRVLIDSQSDQGAWSTVGASSNIIEASLEALIDSIEYGLLRQGAEPPTEPLSGEARALARNSDPPPSLRAAPAAVFPRS